MTDYMNNKKCSIKHIIIHIYLNTHIHICVYVYTNSRQQISFSAHRDFRHEINKTVRSEVFTTTSETASDKTVKKTTSPIPGKHLSIVVNLFYRIIQLNLLKFDDI